MTATAANGRASVLESVPRVFVFQARFLAEMCAHLTRDPAEDMVLVTGTVFARGRICAPHRALEFEKQRSRYGVRADDESVMDRLVEIDRWGEHLVAALHSHPGTGVAATAPSQVDLIYLHKATRAGYRMVSGIFSQDRFLRFLAASGAARVGITGRGVEVVSQPPGPTVFRVPAL